ncbi:uncharacterized protein LOC114261103 [Camellia sinensis]|uniref:uncharacterized protein LOC114261102 n=1 Tax=Camellia sinensis TaxID=4442 RepID=UPI00103653DC|nr:uncharacterized protein LOC114261102 [Camellia sinensis]XP_028057112.1 uncharacterized protein LOC114261103 [Camellia sinensis]
METTTNFIWKLYEEHTDIDSKDYQRVLMVIENYQGAKAMGYDNSINFSAVFLQEFQRNLKFRFTNLIYHEMTHSWQWSGNNQAPVGFTEGIVDYTVFKANYYLPNYAEPGTRNRWDEGYGVTA